jgi:hypothetical protein
VEGILGLLLHLRDDTDEKVDEIEDRWKTIMVPNG